MHKSFVRGMNSPVLYSCVDAVSVSMTRKDLKDGGIIVTAVSQKNDAESVTRDDLDV